MAEYVNNEVQTVTPNNNVLFATERVGGTKCIMHRVGSGLVNLKGITNQCFARFKITFNGDMAIPTGGTVESIQLSIAVDGESVTTMTVTPVAVAEFWNVSSSVFVDVPKCCCAKVSVKNINDQDIAIQNANILVERVA